MSALTATTRTAADVAVDALLDHGVTVMFGIPGTHSLPLYDAIARSGRLRHVLARHEQGAGFMAVGYARRSGRVGVASTISGPGVTNVATPMALAYADSVPLLVISTVPSGANGLGGDIHELRDQRGVMAAVAGWTYRVERSEEIGLAIDEAFDVLTSRRPRGAYIEVPTDTLASPASEREAGGAQGAWPQPDPARVAEAADLLAKAQRPIIVAGLGVTASGANGVLARVAEKLSAPILLGQKSHDVTPSDHPLSISTSFACTAAVNELTKSCDATLVVGSKLGAERTDQGALHLPSPLMHIDIDASEIGRQYPPAVSIVSDAAAALQALDASLPGDGIRAPRDDVIAAVAATRVAATRATEDYFGPSMQFLDAIRAALPRDAVVVADSTMLGYASTQRFPVWEPRTFIHDAELCSIGSGFAMSLGVKVAAPDRTVIALCGDGGFLLTATELASAVQSGIHVIVVVFNDAAYTCVKLQQQSNFGARYIDTDLRAPDFVALARAFGAESSLARSADELESQVRQAAGRDVLTLIEVPLPGRVW